MGLGWRLARDEHGFAGQRLRELLLTRLQDSEKIIKTYFEERERRLDELTQSVHHDPGSIRKLVRSDPHVAQVFVLHESGTLLHPDPRGELNASERRFLTDSGDLLVNSNLLLSTTENNAGAAAPASGWVVRYWGPGLNLLYCRRLPSGRLVGVLLHRSRWIADLIAELPETTDAPAHDGESPWSTRIRLADSNGRPVYDWGSFEPNEGAEPLQELTPSYPLSSWRLQHFVDEQAFASVGRGAYFNLLSMLAATGLFIVMSAAWFYRQYNRNVREAMQRVSFVNQVSHELKTPLTNIRMYAELLERDLEASQGADAETPRSHLNVVVEESQRLSRLIGNVLTFAQSERDQLTVHPRPAVVDHVIAAVIHSFEPALRRRGVEVVFDPAAGASVEVDADALEQILGNLLSNVEKYASDGKRVNIINRQSNGYTFIMLIDEGPGIPARQRERIFRPFHRLSNDIGDSPGTGIGLTIARQLARLHGGELKVIPSERGACFEICLRTPSSESEVQA